MSSFNLADHAFSAHKVRLLQRAVHVYIMSFICVVSHKEIHFRFHLYYLMPAEPADRRTTPLFLMRMKIMMRFERDGKHMIESWKKHVYALSVFLVSTLQTHTLGIHPSTKPVAWQPWFRRLSKDFVWLIIQGKQKGSSTRSRSKTRFAL